jgi:lysophospholipase L1-like esterase
MSASIGCTVAGLIGIAVLFCATGSAQQNSPSPAEVSRQQLEEWRKSMTEQWINDFGDLGRYHEANSRLTAPTPGESRVVFMGDSITDAWKLDEYFPGKPYINRGISGQTTPQMLIRFRPDVINLQPKVVVILAGTNDIAGYTGPMRLEDIENNCASMVELAQAHGIRVVFASVIPVNNYTPRAELLFAQRPPAKILEVNRWLKDFCAKKNCTYLDYFGAMVDAQGLLKQDLGVDGLHPSPAGYKMMAPLAQAAIERALAAN